MGLLTTGVYTTTPANYRGMTWPGNYYGLLLQTNYEQTTATINPNINTSQSEKIPIGGPKICYSQLNLDLDNNYPQQYPITHE